ncbi:unnamed protein product, partial [Meganyctiphanes norvegica]
VACDPLTCTYNGVDGRCKREEVPGTVNVGPQQCKHGCDCYIPEDQDCDNQRKCDRPDAAAEGYYTTGHCRTTCHSDETPYDRCDIDNQDSCSCCLRKKDCEIETCLYKNEFPGKCSKGPMSGHTNVGQVNCGEGCNCWIEEHQDCEIESCLYKNEFPGKCSKGPISGHTNVGQVNCGEGCNCWIEEHQDCGPTCTTKPTGCMCMLPPNTCPDGYCSLESDICDDDHCTCCKESSDTKCQPKNNLCHAPDYCVDKYSSKCPKGFAKVLNTCFKSSSFPIELEQAEKSSSHISKGPDISSSSSTDCDCCKSLACTPNGDQCSGKGDYCVDPEKSCPLHYKTSFDCSKPVVENGTHTQSKLCKCCKPRKIIAVEDQLELREVDFNG